MHDHSHTTPEAGDPGEHSVLNFEAHTCTFQQEIEEDKRHGAGGQADTESVEQVQDTAAVDLDDHGLTTMMTPDSRKLKVSINWYLINLCTARLASSI